MKKVSVNNCMDVASTNVNGSVRNFVVYSIRTLDTFYYEQFVKNISMTKLMMR